ncbi:MAG: DNA replication/repair protein RecF [Bacteroidia bacterium]
MYLAELSLVNFKNYTEFSGDFSPRVNCFVGSNGSGKTNLLDAIHYMAFCKSYFNSIDSQNIHNNEGFLVIQGKFIHENTTDAIYCGIKRGQKKVFKRNNKEYAKLSEHIGLFPLVMVTPNDSELIWGTAEVRRRFIDTIISQYDKSYLESLVSYASALKQRNALLKQFAKNHSFDNNLLTVYDEQLALFGTTVINKRKEFLKSFIPIFNEYYAIICGEAEDVSLDYTSSIGNRDFKTALLATIAKDKALEYTSVGPHRDDLHFLINAFPVKKFASQGQQKSYLLALKLAQFSYINKKKGIKPILLLDDVYDKLDAFRFGKLMELIRKEEFGQVFITDTHEDRMRVLFEGYEEETKFFNVDKAVVKEI